MSERLAAAVAIIDSWPEWPSPVVIPHGPQGSGKSHLAEVWRSESGASDILPLSGSNASVKAGEGPVLFEVADRAGFDEVELFHVINSVRQHGTIPADDLAQLAALLECRAAGSALAPQGGNAGGNWRAGRGAVVAGDFQAVFRPAVLSVDDRIIATIVSRMERSLAAAQEVVERIDRQRWRGVLARITRRWRGGSGRDEIPLMTAGGNNASFVTGTSCCCYKSHGRIGNFSGKEDHGRRGNRGSRGRNGGERTA